MKRVIGLVAIAVLVSSVAAADVSQSRKARTASSGQATEGNGTLGSLTITAQQIGPLEVALDASVTTVGGDGQQVVVTFGGNTYTLNPQIWLYGQIYDSPWNGGCTFWTTSPGPDWCAYGEEYFVNAPTPLNSFEVSFTTTVPVAMNYQTFVIAQGGLTWPTPSFVWFSRTQTVVSSVVETIYIGSTAVPTPTPPPAVAGEPVPTLNLIGILAMIAIMAGIAIFVMVGRK